MTTTLTDVPVDIPELIAKHLYRSTLRALRLVSRDFHDFFSPIALRSIAFSLRRTEGDAKWLPEVCSKPLPALYQHGRDLTIKTEGYYIARYVDGDGMAGLCKVIEQFKNLKSFEMKWESGYDDTEETTVCMHDMQERIVEAAHKAAEGELQKLTRVSFAQWDV